MNKPEYIFAIDLIIEEFKLSNSILISEKIAEELDMEVSIFQIADYLEINQENWLQESQKINYYENNY